MIQFRLRTVLILTALIASILAGWQLRGVFAWNATKGWQPWNYYRYAGVALAVLVISYARGKNLQWFLLGFLPFAIPMSILDMGGFFAIFPVSCIPGSVTASSALVWQEWKTESDAQDGWQAVAARQIPLLCLCISLVLAAPMALAFIGLIFF